MSKVIKIPVEYQFKTTDLDNMKRDLQKLGENINFSEGLKKGFQDVLATLDKVDLSAFDLSDTAGFAQFNKAVGDIVTKVNNLQAQGRIELFGKLEEEKLAKINEEIEKGTAALQEKKNEAEALRKTLKDLGMEEGQVRYAESNRLYSGQAQDKVSQTTLNNLGVQSSVEKLGKNWTGKELTDIANINKLLDQKTEKEEELIRLNQRAAELKGKHGLGAERAETAEGIKVLNKELEVYASLEAAIAPYIDSNGKLSKEKLALKEVVEEVLSKLEASKVEIKNQENAQKELEKSTKDVTKATKEEGEAIEKTTDIRGVGQLQKSREIEVDAQLESQKEKLRLEKEKSEALIDRLVQRYFSFDFAIKTVIKSLRSAYEALSNIDEAFTEMAVVTDYSREQIWGLYDSFKEIANISGFTTAQVAGVTAEYLKQGETLKDSLVLTEAATQAAQIASIAPLESVRYLTSAVRGYRLEAEQAMDVSDKFAAVAAATATDYDGLATAMSKVAAQAYANGVEMDNLMGLLATAMDVTQEAPENIGTAFKTIFARMTQIADYGKTLEDGMNINKVEHALGLVNVSLRDQTGSLRDLDTVLLEVGANWESANDIQKAYITNALAGTRQQTRLLAVFENYDKLMEIIATSSGSAGATIAQQAKYMEGLEAAQNKVNVAWEAFITAASNSDTFINALELAASALNSLKDIIADPVFSKVLLVLLGGGALATGIGSAYSKIQALGEKIKGVFGTAFSKVNAAGESMENFGTLTGKATFLLGKAGPIMLGIGAAAAVVALAWKNAAEASRKRAEALKESITQLEGALYNATKTKEDFKGLLDRFQELDNQVVKTTEDLEEMLKISDQIAQMGGGELLFDNNMVNIEAAENYFDELESGIETTEREYFADARKYITNYIGDKEKLADNLEQAALYMAQDSIGLKEWGEMSASRQETLLGAFKKQLLEAEYSDILLGAKEYAHSETGEQLSSTELLNYANKYDSEGKVVGTDWEKYDQIKFFQPIKGGYADLQEEADATTEKFKEVFEVLDQMDTLTFAELSKQLAALDMDLDELREASPTSAYILDRADLELTLKELNSLRPVLDGLGESAEQLQADDLARYFEAFKQGDLMQVLASDAEKFNYTQAELLTVMQNIAEIAPTITFESLIADLNNFESLGERLTDINQTLESNDWGATSLENVLQLMSEYPGLSEDIMNSISEEGKINASVKNAIIKADKDAAKQKIEAAIIENEAKLAILEAEQMVIAELLSDEVYAKQLADEGKTDISQLSTEELMGYISQSNHAFVESLQNQLIKADEFYSQLSKMQRDALLGEYEGGFANIVVDFSAKLNTGSYDPNDTQAIADSITAQLESRSKSLENQIVRQKGIIAALKHSAEAIDKLPEGQVTGQAKPTPSKKGSKTSNKEAKEYLGLLNKIYVAEQRVKMAELFVSETDAMLAFAQSVEAVGEAAGSITTGYRTSAELMEEQYFLYEQQAKELEHLNSVRKEEQAFLMEGLQGYQDYITIVNGRVIPISENYKTLTAEGMKVVDEFAKSFNALSDEIEDTENSMIDLQTQQNNLIEAMRDSVIEWQEVMIEAIKNEEKKNLDSFKRIIDANIEYIQKRKQLYEDSFKEEDANTKLSDITTEQKSISEKLAALEGASDLASVRRREDLRKQLADLDKEFNDITLQYNRDAFMQSLDDQIDHQNSAYQIEEEAYNARMASGEYFEARIRDITRNANLNALIDAGLQQMTLAQMIEEGYITQEQATAAGLTDLSTTFSEWSPTEQEALRQHFVKNTDLFQKAWDNKTADGAPGAKQIIAKAMEGIVQYITTNSPTVEGKTAEMTNKMKASWVSLTTTVQEFTKNMEGLKLIAPDTSAYTNKLQNLVNQIKAAADSAEIQYKRIEAASGSGSSGSGSGGSSGSGSSGTGGTNTTTFTYPATMYASLLTTNAAALHPYNNLATSPSKAKTKWPNKDIYAYTLSNKTTGLYKRGSKVFTYVAPKTTTEASAPRAGGNTGGVLHTGFATGGTTERTGFHWLDGSPGAAERILSPQQNKAFEGLISDLAIESRMRAEISATANFDDNTRSEFRDIKEAVLIIGQQIVDADKESTERLRRSLEAMEGGTDILKKYGLTVNKR